MTTTQIMEDSSEVMSWDCPQCNRVYEADIRKVCFYRDFFFF